MQLTFEQLEGKDVLEHEGLQALYGILFESPARMIEPPVSKNFRAWLVLSDDQAIGFKAGYELKPGKYYSWLGGVHPEYRKKGLAGSLMELQHGWCSTNGYQTIQTKTKNKWKSMLILNLKHGFDIIGTYTDSKGEPKIILEKNL
ncbi:GNAT family N-acetyltransferase [Fictibacillus barbaricus]|uniref:GNAT superfamily N-acetyltransferase n=1 Tax=Fictibacillus barbaricus TaxID=182136 RepID=A0ABU1U0R6_9BACL|nr:GNAT family N-acetyltransferase [Fictibacillus barbaricus]MDR7073060.1 GNAT superfamily N-acetyltransferase [Fictibacillus barbaricus]